MNFDKGKVYRVKSDHRFHANRLGRFEFISNEKIIVLSHPDVPSHLFAVDSNSIIEKGSFEDIATDIVQCIKDIPTLARVNQKETISKIDATIKLLAQFKKQLQVNRDDRNWVPVKKALPALNTVVELRGLSEGNETGMLVKTTKNIWTFKHKNNYYRWNHGKDSYWNPQFVKAWRYID